MVLDSAHVAQRGVQVGETKDARYIPTKSRCLFSIGGVAVGNTSIPSPLSIWTVVRM